MSFWSKKKEGIVPKIEEDDEYKERGEIKFLNNGKKIINIISSSKNSNIIELEITAAEPVFSTIVEEFKTIYNAKVYGTIVEITFNDNKELEMFLDDWT